MLIKFRISLDTSSGDRVYLTGSSAILGNYDVDRAYLLENSTAVGCSTLWSADIQFDALKERVLFYKYFIKTESGEIIYEYGGGRRLALNSATKNIETLDEWQPNTPEAPFLTDPFAHVFYGASFSPYTQTHKKQYELIIRAVVPNVPQDCTIVMAGQGRELGNWNPAKGVKMSRLKGLKWIAYFSIEKQAGKTLKYRFYKVCPATGEAISEKREERELQLPDLERNDTYIVDNATVEFEAEWPRFAGCTIPISALKSKQSCGIGEIGDLRLLLKWASQSGIRIINILPINDTTQYFDSRDSSPYNCISSIALNPLLVSLEALGELKGSDWMEEKHSLNHRATIDWEDVYAFKMKVLHLFFEQNKIDVSAQPEYYKFVKQNREWLYPYAVFCALRDKFHTADFRRWGEYSMYSQNLVDEAVTKNTNPLNEAARFYIYLQYSLHNQMAEAIDYAHSLGIALKGEYPMSISPNSVDAWRFPHYFKFEGGATLYNWDKMERDNFKWWKVRLRAMSDYYDIYSIGRIGQQSGIEDNKHIVRLLPQLITTSNMLSCGKYSASDRAENSELAQESEIVMRSLSIRKQMEELRILYLEVPGLEENTPYFSIFSTSTCNSPTLRMWLGKQNGKGDASAAECFKVIESALASNSMFAILPLQDWLSLDEKLRNRFVESERINNATDPVWVWKYRMHVYLEQLLEANELNDKILSLVKTTHR